MPIRQEIVPTEPILEFTRHCVRYVRHEWPYARRLDGVPDEGFEERLRESCVQNLQGWSVSEQRELRLGAGLDTASGTAHEIDIVARSSTATAILEAKNIGNMPGKNDVIVFFAKVLDYLLANPRLVSNKVCLAFMSSNSLEDRAIAACLGLGIHPVAFDIRPLPVLIDNVMRMESELGKGLVVSLDTHNRFDDLCAQLNSLGYALDETWLDNRCGYISEDRLLIKAIAPQQIDTLAHEIRLANSACADLLREFRSAKRIPEAADNEYH